MGSCVSLHRDPEAALKLRVDFGSKNDNLVNPSPEKQNIPAAGDAVFKSQWSPAPTPFGSKEETFFDSQAWLESDCDEDFLSVNGDFTPSRGNTPVHERLSVRTTPGSKGQVDATMPGRTTPGSKGQVDATMPGRTTPGSKGQVDATMPEPSPNTKKKRLSELFKDSLGGEGREDGKVDAAGPLKSGDTTPGTASVNASGEMKAPPLEKSAKEVQCCLPRMRSFKDRRNRT